MHMADALISPVVGTSFLAASAAVGAWSVHRLRQGHSDEAVPLMGVMGAFVFTAQMINFAIPGTGASGHLGGGLLLAAVLGPHAAFLTLTAILTVQALFFGDGGLLALGCNIFNLGFFSCYIAWPFVFKPLMGAGGSRIRVLGGALLGAVVALQSGSFSVVIQTLVSDRTELPFGLFILLMQPIHLVIGLVEGGVTAAIVLFLLQHRPETLRGLGREGGGALLAGRRAAAFMVFLALLTGAFFSSFASTNPDGLEWSLLGAAGKPAAEPASAFHRGAAALQALTAVLPDYGFKKAESAERASLIDPGTSFSGLVGGAATLLLLTGAAVLLRRKHKQAGEDEGGDSP